MTDHDGADSAEPCSQNAPTSMSVEDIIERSIGKMNSAQLAQAILGATTPFFDSLQALMSVFTDAVPAWHCTDLKKCHSSSDICRLSGGDWAWDGNVPRSIISEWNLECASSFMKGLPATSFFVGCFLGGFVLPTLGDSWLGRKNVVIVSCLVMSFGALACAFSPNIWVYSAFKFISGIGRSPIINSTLVLLSEKVGKRWRGQAMLLGIAFLELGLLSLPGIAYLARNYSWRTLYLSTSIPGIIFCIIFHFFLYESPRWLIVRGREIDAVEVMKKIGSVDQVSPGLSIKQIKQEIPQDRNPFSSIKILLKRRWAIKRMLASMVLRFGDALMFYSLFFGAGNLGLNVYLITALNAILALSASLLTYLFWYKRCNRRSSLLILSTICGVASFLSVAAGHHHKGIVITFQCVSLFSSSMMLDILNIYVVEMFPTCVRNSATALVRQAFFFASVLVPMLVAIGRKNQLVFHSVFGLVVLISGFSVVCLPETRGKPLCDTMEEQETRDKGSGCMYVK